MSAPDEPRASSDGDPAASEGWHEHPADEPHSWGPVSEKHWSKTRGGANREAVDHMRERSRAPGVAEGGGARNVYCMECDGVIPFTGKQKPERCPHCGVPLDDRVQAMFNWVEIDDVPQSDAGPLLKTALLGLVIAGGFVALLVWSLT